MELSAALDEDVAVAVHQDVGDRRVLQQRLDRPEAQQLVEDVIDELRLLLAVQRLVLSDQQLAHHLADLAAELGRRHLVDDRSEEHTSELQSLMRISYAVFCLKKQKTTQEHT